MDKLNMAQRKILWDLYEDRFRDKLRAWERQRNEDKQTLSNKLLAEVAKNPAVKKALDYGKKYYLALDEAEAIVHDAGAEIMCAINNIPEPKYRWNREAPELVAFKEETKRLEEEIRTKKNIAKAKVYGVNAVYQDIEKEVDEILNSIGV